MQSEMNVTEIATENVIVTFEQAYKRINRCRNLNEKIDGVMQRREELFIMATKTNCAMSGERVQTSGSGDKTARIMCEYADLEEDLNRMIDELYDMKLELQKEIFQCSKKQKVRMVLLNRYVKCYSQKRTAKSFRPHLTVRRIQQLQEEGIKMYQEYLSEIQQ